jgi:hypothetical protein
MDETTDIARPVGNEGAPIAGEGTLSVNPYRAAFAVRDGIAGRGMRKIKLVLDDPSTGDS